MAGLLVLFQKKKNDSNGFGVSAWTTCGPSTILSRRAEQTVLVASSPSFSERPWQPVTHHRPRSRRMLYDSRDTPQTRTRLAASNGNGDMDERNKNVGRTNVSAGSMLDWVGIAVQPIVWISLVSVATTGGGLPAGPFGLLGAVEGLSYLLVVGLAGAAIWGGTRRSFVVGGGRDDDDSSSDSPSSTTVSERLSLATLGLALLVLVKLIADQGCVPNAKPILDYSAYVPVCDAQETPGSFGGGGGGGGGQ